MTQLLVAGSTSLPSPVRYTAMVVVLAAVAAAVVRRLRHRWLGEAAELVLLAVLAVTVPPTVSFGISFGAWHSVRHVARIMVLDPQNATDVAAGRAAAPLARFARKAALPATAAPFTLLVLWQATPGWQAFAVADLSLLAGLTMSHVLLVAWLDHRSLTPACPEAGRRPEVARASSRLR